MKGNMNWAKPESFFAVLRCTTQKYGNNFLKNGEIKFSTPTSWVKYALEKGDGRGDKLEGTLAVCHKLDIENLVELNHKYQKYSDLVRIPTGNHVYFKKSMDMELPCFCLYILKQSMFECPKNAGRHKLTTTISGTYFRDFADNMDPQEIEKLNEEDRPAVVIIFDYKKFEQRLINVLLDLGVKREEIIISPVKYVDFNKYGEYGWWDFNRNPPMELTIKHSRFENQNEVRVIINTEDENIKEILSKPIKIGSIEDIATISNEYHHDGIFVEIHATVEEVE